MMLQSIVIILELLLRLDIRVYYEDILEKDILVTSVHDMAFIGIR
jgi:hypothetical protein